MDQRSIKPGLPAADLFGKFHPRTGEPIVPLGFTSRGVAIWPVLGGEGDDTDPDDPRFRDGGGDDEDDSDDDDAENEDDDDPKSKRDKGKKRRASEEDDDDDEETYTKDEYDRVRGRMKAADRRATQYAEENARLKAQLAKATKRKGKADDDDDDDDEPRVDQAAKDREERREKELRQTRLENGFLRASRSVTDRKTGDPIEWHDAEDALAVAERLGLLDDVLDDDGTVDRREMARALRELARRKPHLVVTKASGRSDSDSDENDDDDQRSSAPAMNGKRKGSRGTPNREALAKRFPVLNRG